MATEKNWALYTKRLTHYQTFKSFKLTQKHVRRCMKMWDRFTNSFHQCKPPFAVKNYHQDLVKRKIGEKDTTRRRLFLRLTLLHMALKKFPLDSIDSSLGGEYLKESR